MPALTSSGTAQPEIRIDDALAADRATQVRLADFEGPLGLLLSLIEARKLDVLTVPLGALAGAYLEALATLPAGRLANISAFVAVASQLILIKSRAMLPRQPVAVEVDGEDELDPEAELRARLLIYRAHREAGRRLEAAAAGRVLVRREPAAALATARAGAVPVTMPPLPPGLLYQALATLAHLAPAPQPIPEMMARTITIAERVEAIREALRAADSIVLQELLEGVRDRIVRAVTFLAMLELVKQREIVVEQAEPWGPIVARRWMATVEPTSEPTPEPAG